MARTNLKTVEIERRPRRPDVDPDLHAALEVIKSPREVAEVSGGFIGATTVANGRKGRVRCPLNYTIRAAGYELVARRIKSAPVVTLVR